MIKLALIVVEIDYSGLIYLLARWQMGSPHRTIGHGQKMDGLATRVVWRRFGGRTIMRCDLLYFAGILHF